MSALDLGQFSGIMDYLNSHNLLGYDGLILSGLAEIVPQAYLRGLLIVLFFMFFVMFYMEWSKNNFQDIRRDYLMIGYLSSLLILGSDWVWVASAYHLGILALDLFQSLRKGMIASKHFLNVIIIWLGSWFLFGDVKVLLYMLPLAIGGVLLLQRFITTLRYGTHHEKSMLKKEGFGSEYRRQKRLEIAAENMAGKEGRHSKQKGIAGTENEIGHDTAVLIANAEATEIHEEAVTAAAKDIAESIQKLEESELDIRKDEEKTESQFEELVSHLDNRLKHANPEQIQHIGTEVLKRLGNALERIAKRIVHDEHYETHITKDTITELKSAATVLEEAIQHIETVQNESLATLKQLEAVETQHISNLLDDIKEKEKKLKHLTQQIAHAKDAQTKQVLSQEHDELKKRKDTLDHERSRLEPYKDYLNKILEKHRRALMRVKTDAEELQKKYAHIQHVFNKIPQLLSENKKADQAFAHANDEFHKGLSELKDPKNVEETTIKLTQGTAHLFAAMRELVHHSYTTQKDVFYATLHDLSDSIKQAISMEESTRLSNQVYEKLAVAFKNLDELAQYVVDGKGVKEEVLDQIKAENYEVKMARRGAWKNFIQKSRFEKVYNTVQDALKQMNKSVQAQKQIYSHTQKLEQTSLQGLRDILHIILQRTLPDQKQFNQKISQVNTALNQAQNATLREKRRAA